MIKFYSIFYFCISLLFRKYEKVEVESLIHCVLSLFFSIYMLKQRFSYNIFRQINLPRSVSDLSSVDLDFKDSLSNISDHSIGYFISDTAYSLVKKDYTYIPHHILSILSLYVNPPVGSVGLFYAELGGFFHHLKRFEKYFPKHINTLIIILYFLIYGYSRVLFFSNVTDYFLYAKKYSYFDYLQIILTYLVIYQNSIWLYKNYLNIKK